MKKTGGLRSRTRSLFKKHKRQKGKICLTRYLQTFKKGDKVKLTVEPAVQKGMYHPRFYGKTGIVKAKKGRCYDVLITDRGKQKTLIVHPIHLKRE